MINKIKIRINFVRLNFRSIVRKIILHIISKSDYVSHLKVGYKCPKKWYGSSYGGFYVNPSLLNNDTIVYSFGIGKDMTFDNAIIKNHRCKVYGFDPTPKSVEYIQSRENSALFEFRNYGISTVSSIEKFYLPKNEKSVSGCLIMNEFLDENKSVDVKMKTLKDIAEELGHQQIDLLKMDIEGSEYEVIESILESDIKIVQLLVEFHDRFFDIEKPQSKDTVELLRKNGFEIFATSLGFEEVSFINKNFVN